MALRTTSTLLVVATVLLLVAPAVAATHWMLYYAGVDETVGSTYEDDEEVFNAPGHTFDGRRNTVVHPSQALGDGTLFLDARIGHTVGIWLAGTEFYSTMLSEALLSRSDLLLPGSRSVSAWYGQWDDRDGDGFIRDHHDAFDHARDEFKWRGLATNEAISVVAYLSPHQNTLDAWGSSDSLSAHDPGALKDHTAHSNEEQGWSGGAPQIKADGGFLMTIHSLVLAGAKPLTGTRVGYDIDDPQALYDVDRYEALSSDIEPLYVAAARAASGGYNELLKEGLGVMSEALILLLEPLQPTLDIVRDVDTKAPGDTAYSLTIPRDAKEPNHPDDDYEGRASFGGVGDAMGSHNSYGGYEDAYHLYVDHLPRLAAQCAGAYAAAPGNEVSSTWCFRFLQQDVVGASQGARTGFALMDFRTEVVLWQDFNKDTHLGNVCDPEDPEEFDAERNTCRKFPYAHNPWPHSISGERVGVCSDSTAKGGSFTVAPVDGEWVGVILVRDYAQSTRVAQEVHWEVLSGSDAVELRWPDACHASNQWIESRDALLFPGGSSVAVRVEALVSILGFKDSANGIDLGSEYVFDVDVVQAML